MKACAKVGICNKKKVKYVLEFEKKPHLFQIK